MPPRTLGKLPSSFIYHYFHSLPSWHGKGRFYRMIRAILLTDRRIIFPFDGAVIALHENGERLERMVFHTRAHETEVWKRFVDSLTEDEVVWDIGANIGTFSVRAMANPHVREVHSFEPHPEIVELLRLNQSLNIGRAFLHPFALGNRVSSMILNAGPIGSADISSFVWRNGERQFEVQCLTVDEVIRRELAPPPSIMKIDVEGWERQVFEGAKGLLAATPPRVIFFEASCDASGCMVDTELRDALSNQGYAISRVSRVDGKLGHPPGEAVFVENYMAQRAAR